MKYYANLHTHSTHSDGKYTPAELARIAAKEGYKAAAVTDHDAATGYPEFKAECDKLGIECIFGVEFTGRSKTLKRADGRSENFHLTAYHFDPEYPPMKEYLAGKAEVVFAEDADIEKVAPECDVCLYFTTIVEGEGMDRCSITLPKLAHKAKQADENAQIVGKIEYDIREDQEESIVRLTKANPNTAVMLLNGAPVDMSAWIDGAKAVVEAWYPGEQGSQAMTELLFGDYSPSGKLPITIPRCVGQLPLY
ncbi:MAG: glycoside hydrolase family 3 C-terminal domain-containing protein, partial [Clostridia bacterium]|nr:glycoside hydrolase family 3 C-terminal domain-containing protein [Clostridia bacterium]